MSISTTVRKAGPFAGNGVQTVFPFAFKVFQASDVVVTRVQVSTGVETTLVLGVDYTVALNPDQDSAPGGSITLLVALAVGQSLALTSNVAALQPVTVTNGGGFFPAVFNGVFDRLTILVQQLAEKIGRTMTIPVTSSGVSLQVPVVPLAVLQWDATGTALVAQSLPDLSLSLALPSQAGHANQPLFTNGASPAWRAITVSDVTGLQGSLNFLAAAVGQVPTVLQVRGAISDGVAQANAQASASLAAQSAFLLNAAVIF